MFRPARAAVLVIAVLLAAPLVLATEPEEAEAAVCPEGMRTMEGVGLVCPQPDGLFEVFTADLVSVGFIHGNDPVPSGAEPDVADAGTTPACVSGASGTYFVQVIYARAHDDTDRYSTLLNQIRYLVGQANKLVDDAGIATGSPASIKVKCVSGQVEVKNEALPTSMGSASFSTIVTDLRNKGYNDGKVKYWIFYDDTGACSCGGQGHIYNDDRADVSNYNNGNGASMFAINYGYNSTRIWLHELGHNMGAVQHSAPYSTGAYHCIDGYDIMCYNDGGPNGSKYSTTYCSTQVWDCNKNTYFHAKPAAGSYLATKWNLGSTVNRFIQFGVPTLTSLSCTPRVELGLPTTCSFVGSDDSTSVRYTVEWGDGTITYVPSSGYVSPGLTQSASHTYASAGNRTVKVTISDSAGYVGNSLTAPVSVFYDPPVLTALSCPSTVEQGATFSCSFRASDNSSGVRYTVSWGDGATTNVPSSGYVAPNGTQSASHAYASSGNRTVKVDVVDSLGHAGTARTTVVSAVYDLTAPTLGVHDPRPGRIYSGCTLVSPTPSPSPRATWAETACVVATASDARSGVARVDVLVDGVLRASDSTAPYVLEFPVPATRLGASVVVRAVDHAGNVASWNGAVDMVSV